MPSLFQLGRILATPGCLAVLEESGVSPFSLLRRHQAGDWGCLGPADKLANDIAVQEGTRVFSAYLLPDGTKVWCITEADRASTCLLLPEEY